MDTRSQYLGIFLDESRDILQILNTQILRLETQREDRKALDEIFRAAHTLKGIAATMGFSNLAALTHHIEDVLAAIREGQRVVDSFLTDLLLSCVDTLGLIIENIAAGEPEPDVSALIERLQLPGAPAMLAETTQTLPVTGPVTAPASPNANWPTLDQYEQAVAAEAQSRNFRVVWIKIDLVNDCLLKGVRAYMVLNSLEQIGEVIKAVPAVPDLEEERFDLEFAVLLVTKESEAGIRERLCNISEIAAIAMFELAAFDELTTDRGATLALAATAAAESVAAPEIVNAVAAVPEVKERITDDWATQSVPAIAEQPAGHSTRSSPLAASATESSNMATAAAVKRQLIEEQSQRKAARHSIVPREANQRIAPTVRVSAERLDSLVNLVGELVIDRTRLQQVAAEQQIEEISDVIRHVGTVISDIHAVVMKLRMMPVERVFSRFPRMVRDLGRELNKDVQLLVEGQDTELDRLMIDEIADPLLHLLRNAIDHGLEAPDVRELTGKARQGNIYLRARHEGDHVILEVEDDGQGIDVERVKRKAVEYSLLGPEDAARLSEKQALDLIFTPGFSTRDEATGISGRGVGMDAVKAKTMALGGALDIDSQPGRGTKITIILPLTLAIIPCMLTEVGREIYAIPISFIEDAHDFADLAVQTVHEEEIALLRGQSLPLLRLQQVLAVPDQAAIAEAAVVVVRVGHRRTGMVVDRLVGQQEVVIKPISKLVGQLHHISGTSILGDGRLALILDAATLI
ncbi:MAG: chemotaxis protein CheA [Cyanobacteria bacterium NC_groundwater_1444_Ag_S-0.65um_54_12]|nr:chemotaxis protein CheA [Cyanobacteria bacterium NC_groundwater_1444_Ag_S-0.65um_54_12]